MKKVLLIDDDSAIHLIASAALQSTGEFQLSFARTGRQGLERAGATRPDLILLDHMLPDIDGDQVILELRGDDRLRDTPVLFVTAKGDQGVDYAALGAQGLITKPFDPDKLAGQIRRVLDMSDEPAPGPAAADRGAAAFPSGGSLEQLRQSFVRRGVKEIDHLLGTVGPKFDIDAARRLAHLWVGRGGTLGHPRISVMARRLDLRLAEGWTANNKWRLQSDLKDVQLAFEEAVAKEGGPPPPAPRPVVVDERFEDPGAAVPARPYSAVAEAVMPDPIGPDPIVLDVDGPAAGLPAAYAPDTDEPDTEAAAADVAGAETPVSLRVPPLMSTEPDGDRLDQGLVVDVARVEYTESSAEIERAEAPDVERRVSRERAGAKPARSLPEPPQTAELPEDVLDVMSDQVVGLFGFDVTDIGAMREAFGAAHASVKASGVSSPVLDTGLKIDAAVVNVDGAGADRAWARVEELTAAAIPILVVGRGRQLLGFARGRQRCEFMLVPWSADEVMFRCYRLLASVSSTVDPESSPEGEVIDLMAAEVEVEPVSDRIVIADDDPTITALLQMTLLEAGLDCHVASAGKEALELVHRLRPRAVVLDVNMPEMDGFQVLAALRNDPRTRSLPVLMLTALRQEADVIRGFRLGADDYVVKPFNPMELSARLERLVRKAS